MEILRQQIKQYVKSNDGYSSEIRRYKGKITDLENKLLLNEKNYEERMQKSLDESSKIRKDNDLLKKEAETFMDKTKTLQKTIENYVLESKKYKKQIRALENEKLSIAKEYKCLLEEKLTIVSGLEKEKEELTVKIKSLKEQIERYEKTNDRYISEMSNYESKIADLENKLSLNEEIYQEHMQSCITASSELREACMHNEQLKKEMESLMKQIKTLENLELKSENYKNEISTLESETISNAKQCKCQEKLTFASGFEKGEESNGNNDDENDEESKNMKNLKQMSQGKNTNKISMPAKHGRVIRSLEAILDGGRRADFTLKSGGREWPVHRAILEGRSGHFETLFRGEWAERDQVGLDDIPEGALDGVLHFLYTGEVGDMSAENVCGIYVAAHRFLLADLKSQCIEYMKKGMCKEIVCGALVIAGTYGEGDLKKSALDCYFRESDRILVMEEWKRLKENHPATIAELLVETFKRKRSNQGQ